jgi:SRSO17 transposase
MQISFGLISSVRPAKRFMIPIVEYPSVVSSYLPAFENVFTRPQMKNFARYATGLMISPNHTVSAMNDLFYAHNDQSALNNFITDSTWSDDELDEARYRVILEGLKRRKNDCEGDGIFLMDDTLSDKTGKHMEYAGKFFDHAAGKYTHAHDILTTHLVKGRLSIPLDFRVYVKEEEFKKKYQEEELPEEIFEDKNQMAREMLKKADSKGVPFLYVVGDSWFFCRETAELASSLGKTWVFQSKSDRVVLMPQGWVHLSDWAKTIPREKFRPVKVRYKDNEQTYWCHEANLRMRSIGGERVRVVVSYDNPECEGEPNFYCSNKLDLKADKMLNVYAKRWKIDCFYRDAKQNLGMEEYEMRKIEGVRRHLAMVLMAHTFLVLGPVPESPNEEDTKLRGIDVARAEAVVETIGSRCRLAYKQVLVSFIALVLRAGRKLENDAERIASLVLSSRARLGADFAKV